MPGLDGTGPRGLGPFTGGGRGYCAIAMPSPGTGLVPYGYVGLRGASLRFVRPIRLWRPWAYPAGCWGWPRAGRRGAWPRRGGWW